MNDSISRADKRLRIPDKSPHSERMGLKDNASDWLVWPAIGIFQPPIRVSVDAS